MAHTGNAVRDQIKDLEEKLRRPARLPRTTGNLGNALRRRLRGSNLTPRRTR